MNDAALYRAAEARLQGLARKIERALPDGIGFALTIFTFGDSMYAGYVSNAQREDMIKALRECADNLEANMDVPPEASISGVDTPMN